MLKSRLEFDTRIDWDEYLDELEKEIQFREQIWKDERG